MTQDTIEAYRHRMCKLPLLTSEQEVRLGQIIGSDREVVSLLLANGSISEEAIAHRLGISVEDARRRKAKVAWAVDKMVTHNLKFVIKIAGRQSRLTRRSQVDYKDLIQEGALGMRRAALKFDVKLGFRFSTYSYSWVRQYMSRAVQEKGRTVHLPCQKQEQIEQLKRARATVARNRKPGIGVSEQVLEVLIAEEQERRARRSSDRKGPNWSLDYVRELDGYAALHYGMVNLDSPMTDGSETTIGEMIADPREETGDTQIMSAQVWDIAHRILSKRELDIVRLRVIEGYKYPQIVEALGGSSRESIRKAYEKAIAKLREALAV